MRLTRKDENERRLKILVILSIGESSVNLCKTFGWEITDLVKFLKRLKSHGVMFSKTKEGRYSFYKLETKIETAVKLLAIDKPVKELPYIAHDNVNQWHDRFGHKESPWFCITR